MLYQRDVTASSLREVIKMFWTGVESQPDERDFAEQMLRSVTERQVELDELLERHSTNWKVSRMPPVDRNILRMGAFELLHVRDVPIGVTLNEAIELGKSFSGEDAGAFINGILDKIARQVPVGFKQSRPVYHGPDEDETDEDETDEDKTDEDETDES